jgi:hypothetical protein
MGKNSDLAPLAAALGRIVDGERDPSLADGLDQVDSAVVTTILSHLAAPASDTSEIRPR